MMKRVFCLLVLAATVVAFSTPVEARWRDDHFRGGRRSRGHYGGYGYGAEGRMYHRHTIENYFNYYRPVITVEWRHMPDGTVKPYYRSYIPAYVGRLEQHMINR